MFLIPGRPSFQQLEVAPVGFRASGVSQPTAPSPKAGASRARMPSARRYLAVTFRPGASRSGGRIPGRQGNTTRIAYVPDGDPWSTFAPPARLQMVAAFEDQVSQVPNGLRARSALSREAPSPAGAFELCMRAHRLNKRGVQWRKAVEAAQALPGCGRAAAPTSPACAHEWLATGRRTEPWRPSVSARAEQRVGKTGRKTQSSASRRRARVRRWPLKALGTSLGDAEGARRCDARKRRGEAEALPPATRGSPRARPCSSQPRACTRTRRDRAVRERQVVLGRRNTTISRIPAARRHVRRFPGRATRSPARRRTGERGNVDSREDRLRDEVHLLDPEALALVVERGRREQGARTTPRPARP